MRRNMHGEMQRAEGAVQELKMTHYMGVSQVILCGYLANWLAACKSLVS